MGSRFWSLGITWRHRIVTIGLGEVVNDDHAPILHGYEDTRLQTFRGHKFDLLMSRDVIGHVIIWLGICGFLLVVHCKHASSILHRYIDMGPQRYWGHDLDLLGSRDIDHLTIGLGVGIFLLVVNDDVRDSAYVVSYWWSNVTMSLSCTVTEI